MLIVHVEKFSFHLSSAASAVQEAFGKSHYVCHVKRAVQVGGMESTRAMYAQKAASVLGLLEHEGQPSSS